MYLLLMNWPFTMGKWSAKIADSPSQRGAVEPLFPLLNATAVGCSLHTLAAPHPVPVQLRQLLGSHGSTPNTSALKMFRRQLFQRFTADSDVCCMPL